MDMTNGYFGFRISDFFRVSTFGFRISGPPPASTPWAAGRTCSSKAARLPIGAQASPPATTTIR
jgi:hypothetical protein